VVVALQVTQLQANHEASRIGPREMGALETVAEIEMTVRLSEAENDTLLPPFDQSIHRRPGAAGGFSVAVHQSLSSRAWSVCQMLAATVGSGRHLGARRTPCRRTRRSHPGAYLHRSTTARWGSDSPVASSLRRPTR